MIIFLSQKKGFVQSRRCSASQPITASSTHPSTHLGTHLQRCFHSFFSIFQILFQGANRAGQLWDLEDRRPRLHNRDQRVLHREVAWPEAPSEHEPDKEALQRLRAGNLDGQGVTKKSCWQNFEGDGGRLNVFTTLGNPFFCGVFGLIGDILGHFNPFFWNTL